MNASLLNQLIAINEISQIKLIFSMSCRNRIFSYRITKDIYFSL